MNAGVVNQSEIDFIMKSDVSVGEEREQCPLTWITNAKWKDILRLEKDLPSAFQGLSKSMVMNQEKWKKVRHLV